MDELIQRLRGVALELESKQDTVFILNGGPDITHLVQQCKSEADILELANRIMDGLIPAINEDVDLNAGQRFYHDNAENYPSELADEHYDDSDPNPRVSKLIIYDYHRKAIDAQTGFIKPLENDEEEDSFDIPEKTVEDLLHEFLMKECINPAWDTWAECFESLGYQYPDCFNDFIFDSPMDIIDIQEGNDDPTGQADEAADYVTERFEYSRRFYSGDLSGTEILMLSTSVIEYCEQLEKDYAVEDNGEDASSEEHRFELKNLYFMVNDQFEHLRAYTNMIDDLEPENYRGIRRQLEEMAHDRDYHKLMDLWTEIDRLHNIQDDNIYGQTLEFVGKHSETRKRQRADFDMADQPIDEIEFEQQQSDLLLDQPSIKMLIQEIAQDFCLDLAFTDDAFKLIQTATEAYLIETFQNANAVAINADLTHIRSRDVQVARRIAKDD